MLAVLVLASAAFVALGGWQVRRLAWKEALIARVDAATHAAPVDAGAVPQGPLDALEYHTVVAAGRYEPRGTTLVAASTELGAGYWVLEPLAGRRTVWVNRGFVPAGTSRAQAAAMTPAGVRAVSGLIRLSEPGGTWLRANRVREDRWYSRDLAAMARVRGVAADPRWFIDARGETPPAPGPVPGLTVISFPNNHLQYALTWFALAVLSAGALIVLWRRPP